MSQRRPKYITDGAASYSISHRMFRLLWMVSWKVLASWTPPSMHAWRRFLLRSFGAKMGARSDVRGSAEIWYPPNLIVGERAMLGARVNCYNMAPITIEAHALVSQDARLLAGTHDIDVVEFTLVVRPITIRSRAWIAAGATVGPGVVVGEGAVLGAMAVTFSSLEPWMVYVGNPATAKRRRINTSDATVPANAIERRTF